MTDGQPAVTPFVGYGARSVSARAPCASSRASSRLRARCRDAPACRSTLTRRGIGFGDRAVHCRFRPEANRRQVCDRRSGIGAIVVGAVGDFQQYPRGSARFARESRHTQDIHANAHRFIGFASRQNSQHTRRARRRGRDGTFRSSTGRRHGATANRRGARCPEWWVPATDRPM